MRRKAGKNVTVKNRSIRARLTAVTVTLCAVLSLPAVPAYADQFSHTYHTKVETTVQVTVRDADGDGGVSKDMKTREYQICRITYDLTVRETGQPTDAVLPQAPGRMSCLTEPEAALFCGLHCCSLSASALLPYTELPGKEKSRHRPTPEKPNNTSIKRCRKAQTWFFGVFFCGASVKA